MYWERYVMVILLLAGRSSVPAAPPLPSSAALRNTPASRLGKRHSSLFPRPPRERRRPPPSRRPLAVALVPATTVLAWSAACPSRSHSVRAAPVVPARSARARRATIHL